MDRATLLRNVRKLGWQGKSLPDLKEWIDEQGYDLFESDGKTAVDIDKAWGTKATITLDPGERINELKVESPEDETEPDETLMEDEEDEELKSRPSLRQRQEAGLKRLREVNGKASDDRKAPSIGGRFARDRKRYDATVASGSKMNVPGMGQHRPIFKSGEDAEGFGAWIRLAVCGHKNYAQKANDLAIVGKAHNTIDNSLGGALVPEQFIPELIELKNEYGAARQAAGVQPMNNDIAYYPRLTGDLTVYEPGEGKAATESNMTFDNVTVTAREQVVLGIVSLQLLNDSAINVADAFARSAGRSAGQYEDQGYFLGQNNFNGINSVLDSDSKYDAALSSGWDDYTVTKIEEWLGKIPTWALPNTKIVCTPQFYRSVLLRLAASAGGNTGAMLRAGFDQGMPTYDGIPVILSNVHPTSYSADQVVAHAGAFDLATKFGEVTGSNEIAQSSDRYFENRQVAIRLTQRVGITVHDVGGTNSGVIGLQD